MSPAPPSRRPDAIMAGVVVVIVAVIAALAVPWRTDRVTPLSADLPANGGGMVDDGQSENASAIRLENTLGGTVRIRDIQPLHAVNVDVDGFTLAPEPVRAGYLWPWPPSPEVDRAPSFDPSKLQSVIGAEVPASPDSIIVVATIRLRPGKDVGWLRGVRISYSWSVTNQEYTLDVPDTTISACTRAVVTDPARRCRP